ncbi:MAG: hypothetical protein ACI8PG_003719 [Planctomycetota bacterium]
MNAQDAIEEAAPPTPQINIRAYAAHFTSRYRQ